MANWFGGAICVDHYKHGRHTNPNDDASHTNDFTSSMSSRVASPLQAPLAHELPCCTLRPVPATTQALKSSSSSQGTTGAHSRCHRKTKVTPTDLCNVPVWQPPAAALTLGTPELVIAFSRRSTMSCFHCFVSFSFKTTAKGQEVPVQTICRDIIGALGGTHVTLAPARRRNGGGGQLKQGAGKRSLCIALRRLAASRLATLALVEADSRAVPQGNADARQC